MATIQLKPIKPTKISFWIKGTSPIIQHAWGVKGPEMLKLTPQERRKLPKKRRNPEEEAKDATHRTEDGDYGIPVTAFKASLITAAHKDIGLEKTLVRKSLFIPSNDPNSITKMECSEPFIREDIVRVGTGVADLRYRPQFNEWRVNIIAEIDESMLTVDDLVNLVDRAGFSVGIGEWRPEKGGDYGRYKMDTTEPVEVIS